MRRGPVRTALVAVTLAVTGLFATAGPAAAATEATINYCTVRPWQPYTFVDSSGTRWARASIYVYCSRTHSGIANAQIKEADYGLDDQVSSLASFSFSISAGQTVRVGVVTGKCRNFDSTGAEELYTHARINVGGVNSSWADTNEVSTTC